MNQVVRFSLLLSVICNYLLLSAKAASQREDAFSRNINNYCFNKHWKNLLAKKVDCTGYIRTGLCHGSTQLALFAVCYNKDTLIPEYTGHIVEPAIKRIGGKGGDWRNDIGEYGNMKILITLHSSHNDTQL
jgi:hypothetical protein